MKHQALYILCAIALICLTSCVILDQKGSKSGGKVSDSVEKAAKTASEAEKVVSGASKAVREAAEEIKTDAAAIDRKVTGPDKIEIEPHIDNIDENAGVVLLESEKLRSEGDKLNVLAKELRKTQKLATDLGQDNESLVKQNEKLVRQRDGALRRGLMYMIMVGVAAIAISLTLFFYGNPRAISGAIGGLALVVTALAVSTFVKYFALIGLVGLLILIAVIAYEIFEQKMLKKALKETVHTVEATKTKMPDDHRTALFGEGAVPGAVTSIQSERTRELVAAERERLRSAIHPTIPATE